MSFSRVIRFVRLARTVPVPTTTQPATTALNNRPQQNSYRHPIDVFRNNSDKRLLMVPSYGGLTFGDKLTYL